MSVGSKAPETGPFFEVTARNADGQTWGLHGAVEEVIIRDWLCVLGPERRLALLAAQPEVRSVVEAARIMLGQLPEGEIEVARECWGNTNTRIVADARRDLDAALAPWQAVMGR